jgi:hypothetical protein
MCEYCGCQAVAAINELTREHDLVVDLITEVRSALAARDLARVGQLVRPELARAAGGDLATSPPAHIQGARRSLPCRPGKPHRR